jgi:UDP-N-acetylmuramoyl-L-alanyl-D-glutamate--2,6-diaminopimelate ligase
MSDILSSLYAQGVAPASITVDSRLVGPGSLFLAYPGERSDGRDFIAQAIRQGAAAIAWESQGFNWDNDWKVPNLPVRNLGEHRGLIADSFYGHPSEKLWVIGVTGTNGKTSCSHWLAQALNHVGRKTALVGTLGNGFPGALSEAINTTPDPILLHGMLANYLKMGAKAIAMEVSSHGLEQGRVSGVHFDVAVFTNLSRDHLDYHGDMQAYGAAKKKLFEWEGLRASVLNIDDAFGAQLAAELQANHKPVLTYGFSDAAMVRGTDLTFSGQALCMQVTTPMGIAMLTADVLGRFNAYNMLAVLAALLSSGVSLQDALTAIAQIKSVAGRMQQLGGGELPLVVIDYAHTPDALENVLQALREQTTGKLICVFGCGGQRDQGKRPLMGEVAARLADQVIVTTDNPRDEAPETIALAIASGIHGGCTVELDRAVAIATAIRQARAGDIVLLAGKGHEDYQEIAGVKYPFSDEREATNALKEWRA